MACSLLDDSLNPEFYLALPLRAGVTGMCHHTWLFFEFLGTKLKSHACAASKCFVDGAIFPTLLVC